MSRVKTITSYNDVSASADINVVNQVEYAYNGYRLVAETKQSHDGKVVGATPSVVYSYEDGDTGDGIADYVRLSQVTYPDGRQIDYDYGTTGSSDDALNLVVTIGEGPGTYAEYEYLGAGTIVAVSHPDVGGVNFDLTLDYNTTGNYEGWDTFGRVVNQEWTDGQGTPTTLDKYVYTYDRNSNRTARDNQGPSAGTTFDEVYRYDDLDRLEEVDRNGSLYQDWTLDGLGNWASFTDDGAPAETRTHNAANELETSSARENPEYDAAGNMISGPNPDSPGTRQHYVYDAWNRLVGVYDDDGTGDPDLASPLATFEYDGRNYRIRTTAGGVVEAFFYNENQQLLEERQGADEDPLNQYVWDLRYVDAPIVRFHDANTNGSYGDAGDNILYYLNDANMNVTGLVDASTGAVVERYHYDPYGRVEFLSDVFASLGTQATQYGNDFLYTGRKLDPETGLMYYRARYYDPSLGRFVQRDPIGYAAGWNLYQYVRGGPVNLVDPTGLEDAVYTDLKGNEYGDWKYRDEQASVGEVRADELPNNLKAHARNLYYFVKRIQFHPKNECDCDEIAFISAAKIVGINGATYRAPADQDHVTNRTSESGWAIDRNANRKYAWFGYKNDGTPGTNVIAGYRKVGRSGSEVQFAFLADRPVGTRSDLNQHRMYESCAICKKGSDVNVLYACLTWGFQVDAKGRVTADAPVHLDAASENFSSAVAAWNEQASGDQNKRNHPNQEQIDIAGNE